LSAWLDLARAHAPFLVAAAPLCAAAIAFILPSPRLAWAVGVAACAAAAALAIHASTDLLGADGAAVFASGFSLDGLEAFSVPVLALSATLVLVGWVSQRRPVVGRSASYALTLFLLTAGGWLAALAATNFVVVFLCVEAAWLASLALVSLSERPRGGLNGALRMLAMGGAGAALFIVGAALIGAGVGSLSLGAAGRTALPAPPLAAAGFALALFSLALKAGVAPLHGWAGPAFGRASGFTAAMLGAVNCAGATALVVRFAADALAAPAIAEGLSVMLAALGSASVVIGSAQAMGAVELRRLAAYALAALSGGVLLSAALGSPAGYAAALVQLFALAAAALGLLCGAAAAGVRTIAQLDGLSRRAPLASAGITASALSLISAPLTIGFLGRWRLVEAAIGAGWWWAAGAMVVASLAGVFYGGRLIERIYFRRAEETLPQVADSGVAYAPALFAAIAATALGLAPGVLLTAAAGAAALLSDAPL